MKEQLRVFSTRVRVKFCIFTQTYKADYVWVDYGISVSCLQHRSWKKIHNCSHALTNSIFVHNTHKHCPSYSNKKMKHLNIFLIKIQKVTITTTSHLKILYYLLSSIKTEGWSERKMVLCYMKKVVGEESAMGALNLGDAKTMRLGKVILILLKALPLERCHR